MSEKLQRCPFCWSAVNIVFHSQYAVVECKNYECAATTRKIFVKPDAEHEEMESAELKLAEIWNRRPPLYSPVKPEDITDGWYWHKPSADDDPEIVYIRCEDGTFGMNTQDRFITVLELYMWGGVLFRIPELPELEVPE